MSRCFPHSWVRQTVETNSVRLLTGQWRPKSQIIRGCRTHRSLLSHFISVQIWSSPPNMSETLVLFLTVLFLWNLRLSPSVSQLSIKCRTLLSLGSIYLPRPLSSLTFVSSKLDFCNSLLYGILKRLPRKLRSVQNPAARLVTSSSKVDHVIPFLMQLHWLPIAKRIKFNCSFTFIGLHDLSPSYIKELHTS